MTSPVLALSRTIGLAVAALALAACSGESGGGGSDAAGVTPYLQDIMQGDANAPVLIEEYASLSCSHCRDFWKQDYPRLKAEYIDTGKVRYTIKEFAGDEIAAAGAAIARCKGPDNYYAIVDSVFTAQYDILMAARDGTAGAKLVQIAGQHGVTPEEVRACLSSDRITKFLADEQRKALQRGVKGTPAVYVNGEALEDHRYPALKAKIESILNPGAAPVEPAAPDTPVPTTPVPTTPVPTTPAGETTPPATEVPPSE